MADIRIIPSIGAINVTGSAEFKGAGGSTLLYMTGSGGIGVGTTVPLSEFHVVSSGTRFVTLDRSGTRSYDLGVNSSGTFLLTDNTAAADRIAISLSGSVGIGTTQPGQSLDVVGTVKATGDVRLGTTSTNPQIVFTGNSVNGFTNGYITWGGGINTTPMLTISTPGSNLEVVTGYNEQMVVSSGAGIIVHTNNGSGTYTNRLQLNRDGSLNLGAYGSGANTGTAAYGLSVDSSGNVIESTLATINGSGTANYIPKWSDSDTLTNSILFESASAVGVGITTGLSSLSNSAKFEVYDTATRGNGGGSLRVTNTTTSQTVLALKNTTSGKTWEIAVGGTNNSEVPGGFYIYEAGVTSRLVITGSNGNVGIGTKTPGYKLDVNGNAKFASDVYFYNTVLDVASNFATQRGAGFKASTGKFEIASSETALELSRFNTTGAVLSVRHSGSQVSSLNTDGGAWFSGDVEVGGDLTVDGIITAKEFHTTFVSASIVYASGSTKFGDTTDDIHQFTGKIGAGISTPQVELHVKGNNGWGEVRVEGQTFASGHGGSLEFYSEGTALADIYSSTAKNLIFRTNGSSEKMRILSDGNVGIGTSVPVQKLHISGSGSTYAKIEGTGTGTAGILTKNGSREYFIGTYYNVSDAWEVVDMTAGALTRLIVKSDGNVGIGTTSPATRLHAVTSVANGQYRLETTHPSGIPNLELKGDSSATIRYISGSSNVIHSRIDLRQNGLYLLGDGATNQLVVKDTGVIQITDYGSGTNTGTQAYNLAVDSSGNIIETGIAVDGSGTANYIPKWSDSDTLTNSVIYQDANGNIGIGTTVPDSKLNVYTATGRNFRVDQSTANVSILRNDYHLRLWAGNGYDLQFETGTSSTRRMTIAGGGNVGINTTAPSAKLNVVGSADVLIVEGSGSTSNTTIMAVDGNNGRLFEVSDDLSDSLFSVNTIAGLPVMEAFADNRVVLGAYNQNDLYITGSRVGIGLSTPQAKLQVTGSFGLNGYDANFPFFVTDSSTAASRYTLANKGMGFNLADDYAQLQLYGGNGGYIDFANAAEDSDARIIYYGGTRLELIYGKSVAITGTGVGIGTQAPDYLFQVYDNNDIWHTAIGGATGIVRIGGQTSSGAVIQAWNPTTNGTRDLYLQRDGGSVGIGTSGPTTTLDVRTDSGVFIKGATGTIDARIALVPTTGGRQYGLRNYGSSFGIKDESADVIRQYFHYDGNTGIGTTGPNAKLEVNVSTTGSAGDGYALRYGANQVHYWNLVDQWTSRFQIGSTAGNWQWENSGGTRMVINANGNVGIGLTTPGAPLHVFKTATYSAIISRADWNSGTETRLGIGKQYGVLGYISTDLVETTNDTSYIALNYKNGLSTYAEGLRVYNTGNVGIGNTTPNHKLVVAGNMAVSASNTEGAIWLGNPTQGVGLYRDNNYDLVLAQPDASSYPLYLAGAGNVVVSIDSNDNETDRKFIVGNNAVKSSNELFSVNESGNVYISNELTVDGIIRAREFHTTFVSASIIFQSGSTLFGNSYDDTHTFYGGVEIIESNATPTLTLTRDVGGTTYTYGQLTNVGSDFYVNGLAAIFINADSNSDSTSTDRVIKFGNRGSELMTLDASGNLGINTATPTRKLHIVSSNDTRGIMVQQTLASSYAEVHFSASREYRIGTGGTTSAAEAANNWYVYDATAAAQRLVINPSGYVGIGNTNPGDELVVNSPGNSTGFTLQKSASDRFRIEVGSSSENVAISANLGYMSFGTNGATAMYVSGSSIGIGTTNPPAALTIRGTGVGDSTSTFGVILNRGTKIAWTNTGHGTTGEYIYSQNASPYAIRVHSGAYNAISFPNTGDVHVNFEAGNLGVGTTSPTAKLHVVGDTIIQGRTFANHSNQYNNSVPGIASFGATALDNSISYYSTGKTIPSDTRGIVWTGKHYIITDHYNPPVAVFYDNNFEVISNVSGSTAVNLPVPSGYNYPHGAAWDGRYLYCIVYGSGQAKIVGYDVHNGTTTATIVVESSNLAVAGDTYDVEYAEGHLYVVTDGYIHIYKLEGKTITHVRTTGQILGSIEAQAITYDGSYLWITQNENSVYKVNLDGTLEDTLTSGYPPYNIGWAWNGENIAAVNYTTGGVYILNTSFKRIDTEVLAIMGGKVGIGITAPTQELHLKVTSGNADVRVEGPTATNYTDFYRGDSDGGIYIYGNTDFKIGANSGGGSNMFVADVSSGNIGINIATPGAKLDVNSGISTSSTDVIKLTQATNGADKAAASLGLSIQNGGEATNAADLWFTTANGGSLVERMRITSGGTLRLNSYGAGNGTGTPAYHLAVNSSGYVIESNSFTGSLQGNITGTAASETLATVTGRGASTSTASTFSNTLTVAGGGNTLVLVKGTGSPAIAFAGTSDEATGLIEGVSGGGLKFYSRTGTLSSPTSYDAFNIKNDGNAFFNYNVGIGTTTPGAKLHVSGSSNVLAKFHTSYALSTGFADVFEILDSGMTGGGLSFNIGKSNSTKNLGKLVFNYVGNSSDSNYLGLGFYDADNILNVTAGSRVGIGVTNPVAPFHVKTTAAVDNVGMAVLENDYASGGVYFPALSVINTRGNHSYGVVAEFKTDTSGDSDRPSILFYGAQAAHSWQVGQTTSNAVWGSNNNFGIGYRASNDPGTFNTWPTNYFTITTGGQVGIGTTNPGWKLHVEGTTGTSIQDALVTLKVTSATHTAGLMFVNSGNTSTYNDLGAIYAKVESGNAKGYLGFYTRNSDGDNTGIGERLRITANGNLRFPSATNGNSLNFNDYSNVFSEYSSGDLYLASNFYGNIGASGYKVSVTGAYGAAGIAISGTNGGLNGNIRFFADDAASRTAGDAITPTERMRILGNGNVGIGVTNPYSQLSLKNQINGGTAPLSSYGAGSGTGLGQNFFNGYYASDSDGLGPYPRYFDIVSTGYPDGTNGGSNIRFFTNPIALNSPAVERMRIASSGNVGIGATDPADKLQVSALGYGFRHYGDASNYLRTYAGSGYQILDNGTNQFGYFSGKFYVQTGGTDKLNIDTSGNVGIGSTAPEAKLNVVGGADVLIVEGSGSTANTTIMAVDGNNGRLFEVSDDLSDSLFSVNTIAGLPVMEAFADNRVVLGAYNQCDLVITGSKVGIGTCSPSTKLHVKDSFDPDDTLGYVHIENTNTTSGGAATNSALTVKNYHGTSQFMQWEEEGLRIGTRILTNGGFGNVVFTAGSDSEKMRIQSNGNVGIGSASPAYLLDVSGTIRATGDVIAYSDQRVKENVVTLENSLELVKSLRGVSYNKIGEPEKKVGVIAQEILEVLPEVVQQDSEGMYSVAYGNITAVLIEAIKEQQLQIEELREEIKKLKG